MIGEGVCFTLFGDREERDDTDRGVGSRQGVPDFRRSGDDTSTILTQVDYKAVNRTESALPCSPRISLSSR